MDNDYSKVPMASKLRCRCWDSLTSCTWPACFYDQFLPAVAELSVKQMDEAVEEKLYDIYREAWGKVFEYKR